MSDAAHGKTIYSDLEFRDFVVSTLASLNTKMTAAVGEDGQGGALGTLKKEHEETKDRVTSLEESRTLGRGIAIALGFLWAGITAIGAHFLSSGQGKH